MFAVRKPEMQGQTVEVKQPVSQRDYLNLLTHRDDGHLPIFKTRRCFLFQVALRGLKNVRDICTLYIYTIQTNRVNNINFE